MADIPDRAPLDSEQANQDSDQNDTAASASAIASPPPFAGHTPVQNDNSEGKVTSTDSENSNNILAVETHTTADADDNDSTLPVEPTAHSQSVTGECCADNSSPPAIASDGEVLDKDCSTSNSTPCVGTSTESDNSHNDASTVTTAGIGNSNNTSHTVTTTDRGTGNSRSPVETTANSDNCSGASSLASTADIRDSNNTTTVLVAEENVDGRSSHTQPAVTIPAIGIGKHNTPNDNNNDTPTVTTGCRGFSSPHVTSSDNSNSASPAVIAAESSHDRDTNSIAEERKPANDDSETVTALAEAQNGSTKDEPSGNFASPSTLPPLVTAASYKETKNVPSFSAGEVIILPAAAAAQETDTAGSVADIEKGLQKLTLQSDQSSEEPVQMDSSECPNASDEKNDASFQIFSDHSSDLGSAVKNGICHQSPVSLSCDRTEKDVNEMGCGKSVIKRDEQTESTKEHAKTCTQVKVPPGKETAADSCEWQNVLENFEQEDSSEEMPRKSKSRMGVGANSSHSQGKGLKEYELKVDRVEVLRALGFKELCEGKYSFCKLLMQFKVESQIIILQATYDCGPEITKEAKNFLSLCVYDCPQLEQVCLTHLQKRPNALEHLNMSLEEKRLQCFVHSENNALAIYIKPKQRKDVVEKAICDLLMAQEGAQQGCTEKEQCGFEGQTLPGSTAQKGFTACATGGYGLHEIPFGDCSPKNSSVPHGQEVNRRHKFTGTVLKQPSAQQLAVHGTYRNASTDPVTACQSGLPLLDKIVKSTDALAEPRTPETAAERHLFSPHDAATCGGECKSGNERVSAGTGGVLQDKSKQRKVPEENLYQSHTTSKPHFYEEIITVGDDGDAHIIIADLQEKVPGEVLVDFDKAKKAYVLGIKPSVKSKIDPFLHKLKTPEKHIPLPGYKVKYCKRHLDELKHACKQYVAGKFFELKVGTSPEGEPGLLVKTDRQNLNGVIVAVHRELAKVVIRKTTIHTARSLFLQDDQKTHQLVQRISTEHKCLLSVRTPLQTTLIHAKMEGGQELMVCCDSIADSGCQVLVIPLCEGHTQWPDLYRYILREGFLPEDISRYTDKIGSPGKTGSSGQKKPCTLTLECNNSFVGKKIVVMFVARQMFKHYLEYACKEALQSAFSKEGISSVAVPLDFCSEISGSKTWKTIVPCIVDDLEHRPPGTLVKLFLEGERTYTTCLGREIEQHLVLKKMIFTSHFENDKKCESRITVMVGEVPNVKADVIVNSTDQKLLHREGTVAKILLREAGADDLLAQCKQLYPEGLSDSVVAITSSCSLKNYKAIFHIALRHGLSKTEKASRLLQELEIRVQACLAMASAYGYHSIAFPTLGLGNLKYPPHQVARSMFSAAREFFAEMPHSCVENVYIVCFHDDQDAVKVFKRQEAMDKLPRNATFFESLEVRGTHIHVLQGDYTAVSLGADVVVCGQNVRENFQDYKTKVEETGTVVLSGEKPKDIMKTAGKHCTHDKCRVQSGVKRKDTVKIAGKHPDCTHDKCSSLQVNMETFGASRKCSQTGSLHVERRGKTGGPDSYDGIITALNSDLGHVSIVYLVVACDNDVYRVTKQLEELKAGNGATSTGFLRWLIQTSNVQSAPSTSGETTAGIVPEAPEEENGSVCITGLWKDSAVAEDEVLNLRVPDHYERKAAEYLERLKMRTMNDRSSQRYRHAFSIAGQGVGELIQDAMREGSEAVGSDQVSDVCMFTIPIGSLEATQKEQLFMFLKNEDGKLFQGHNQSRDGKRIEIRAKLNDLLRAVSLTLDRLKILAAGVGSDVGGNIRPSSGQVTKAGEKKISRELELVEAEALKYLLAEAFTESFHTEYKEDGHATISGLSSCSLWSKIDCLRREDMQLPDSDLSHLGNTALDAQKEGVEAFIKPLPEQGRVAILTFDYSTITKAKHLVSVKAGKVKVTSRARRRFDGGEGSGQSDLSLPQSLDLLSSQTVSVESKEFTAQSGITVRVYKTDITKLPVDAIVNAANQLLQHGGGVANAIAKAAGMTLEEEGDAYVRQNGPLKVTEVLVTTAGAMPCKKVLHAVGPRWDDYSDKTWCKQDLKKTIFNCLVTAHKHNFKSLAVSSISSAIFGVPRELCAQMYLSAVKSFDQQYGGKTCLQVIHFVDVNEAMVSIIQNVFTEGWTVAGVALTGPVKSETHPAQGTDYSLPGNSSQTSRSAVFGSESDRQPSHLSGRHQAEGGSSHSARKSSQSSQSDTVVSMTVSSGSQESSQVLYQFHFVDFDLIFKRQRHSAVGTEAVVLWQYSGRVLRSEESKQLIQGWKSEDIARLKACLTQEAVEVVTVENKMYILPVLPTETLTRGKVCHLLEQAINQVDKWNKSSVAVTCSFRRGSKQANKDVEEFAAGIYQAVKNYIKRDRRSVTALYIVDTEWEILKATEGSIAELVVIDRSAQEQNMNLKSLADAQSRTMDPSVPDCVICQCGLTDPKTLNCNHTFCSGCIMRWMKEKPVCPSCGAVFGVICGNQPLNGTMEMRRSFLLLSGFMNCDCYEITYNFPPGKQNEEHPNPGRQYAGITRKAYLPDTPEGRKVLMLLKVAFDRRLIFTIGQSSTTGRDDCLIWNDIHHKTSISGGPDRHGYPDDGYLSRVQKELADKRVTYEDLTDFQKDFINNPLRYADRYSTADFSRKFQTDGVTGSWMHSTTV